MRLEVTVGRKTFRLELEKAGLPAHGGQTVLSGDAELAAGQHESDPHSQRWMCRVDGREILLDVAPLGDAALSILRDGESIEVTQERAGNARRIFVEGVSYEALVRDARSLAGIKREGSGDAGAQRLAASMPGKVVRVMVSEGDRVTSGQGIAVVEAMKMQNEIRSPKDGVIKKLMAQPGMNVNGGDVLAVVE